jgi:hypothetical protein
VTTEAEIIAAAILTAAGTLGALVRASAGIVRDAMAAATSVIARNTDQLQHVAELLGRVDVRTENAHARVVEVHQEISGVHDAADPEALKPTFETKTPARPTTYAVHRGKTNG